MHFNLLTTLVKDSIQKRRAKPGLFSFWYNMLPKVLTICNMDQASEFCYSKDKKLAENFCMGTVFWGNSSCLHLKKCRKWSPISDFQQGYLKNYWVLENITGFLFSWHRGTIKVPKTILAPAPQAKTAWSTSSARKKKQFMWKCRMQ